MVRRGRQRRPTAAAGQQLVGKGSLQRVGRGRLAVVEVQGGERGRGQGPGVTQPPVHLLQGRHVARLGQQLDPNSGLTLPLGPEQCAVSYKYYLLYIIIIYYLYIYVKVIILAHYSTGKYFIVQYTSKRF